MGVGSIDAIYQEKICTNAISICTIQKVCKLVDKKSLCALKMACALRICAIRSHNYYMKQQSLSYHYKQYCIWQKQL